MLDDDLTLLDGTEVISTAGVAKLTGDLELAHDLLTSVSHETTLQGQRYYHRAVVLRLVAGVQRVVPC